MDSAKGMEPNQPGAGLRQPGASDLSLTSDKKASSMRLGVRVLVVVLTVIVFTGWDLRVRGPTVETPCSYQFDVFLLTRR
jgi:hypothetical protein